MKVGPYTLRSQQQTTVEKTRQALRECRAENLPQRVVLQGVCGFGKTIVSSFFMQSALEKGKRPAFMVHGRQLVFQKSEKLADAGIPHTVVMADCKGSLRPAATPYEGGSPECSVISKDTYDSLINSHGVEPFDVDLWIIDEAHDAKSESWWRLIEKSEAPVIGMTATPSWSNGLGMGDRYSKLVISATHEELLAAGRIVPCRVFEPWGVDTAGVDKNPETGEYVQNQIEGRCAPLVGNFIEEWWKLAEGRTTAFYASSVAHSMAQAEAFRDGDGTLFARPLSWEHIDADTPPGERGRILKALAERDLDGVSNYAVLRQGVDCPAIDCIQLGVSMASLNAYLQTTGRGGRTHPGKEDFLIIDHGHNRSRLLWPQLDREWQLDNRKPMWEPESMPKSNEKTCKACGYVYKIWQKVCPNCGESKIRKAEMVMTVRGELVEVSPPKPKEKRVDRIPDEQKAFEKLYFPSSQSKSPQAMTFNQLRGAFQRKNPHLRIVQNGDKTVVQNMHTKTEHVLGNVPPPKSPLWDCKVRDVPREKLQKAAYVNGKKNDDDVLLQQMGIA